MAKEVNIFNINFVIYIYFSFYMIALCMVIYNVVIKNMTMLSEETCHVFLLGR